MQRPTVSIVINNYNYGQYLAAAIRSALDQTYQPIELLVVDDGSTDNSHAVIESFGTRLRAIYKKNGGQGSTYNVGFVESVGELIHFLDSDDILLPNAIEESVKLWAPGVAKIHFHLRVVEGADATQTDALLPASPLAEGSVVDTISQTGSYISPPATGNLYSRKALAKILPMPEAEWITAADTYPVFLTPLFGEVRACRKALGLYRVHGANQDAQTKVTSKLLLYRLKKEAHRDALFCEFCAKEGIPYQAGAVANDMAHMKIRLSSMALNRGAHPYPNDTLLKVAWRTAALTWKQRSWSLKKKVLFTFWVVCTCVAPSSIVLHAIDVAFVPTKRWKLVQRWASPKQKGVLTEAIRL